MKMSVLVLGSYENCKQETRKRRLKEIVVIVMKCGEEIQRKRTIASDDNYGES